MTVNEIIERLQYLRDQVIEHGGDPNCTDVKVVARVNGGWIQELSESDLDDLYRVKIDGDRRENVVVINI